MNHNHNNNNHHNHNNQLLLTNLNEIQFDNSLPMILRPISIIERCKHELQTYHRWLGIFFHYSKIYSRPLRTFSLLMNILIMLFVQSVTYNLIEPDDGTCEKQHTETKCLKISSQISNQPNCQWDVNDSKCKFRDITNDFELVMIAAIISAIISAPFSILLQSLILHVLSSNMKKENNDEEKQRRSYYNKKLKIMSVNNKLTHIRSTNTLPSFDDSNTTKMALETTLAEDFNSLMKELKEYRQSIVVNQNNNHNNNNEELKRFDGQ